MPGISRSVGSSFGSSRRAPRAPRPAFVFVRPTAEAERAFTVAAEAIAPALERYVARFVRGDAHLARDLVQDTLLSAWKHLPDLREPNLLQAWLYRVAYRNAMSVLRRRGPRRRPIRSLDAGSGVEPASRPPVEGPLWRVGDDWSGSDELGPRLLAEVAELPPKYEQPVRLHYLERMDLRRTARTLGIPIPTLKMRLHRARALLRRHLGGGEATSSRRAPPPPPPTGRTRKAAPAPSIRSSAAEPGDRAGGAS